MISARKITTLNPDYEISWQLSCFQPSERGKSGPSKGVISEPKRSYLNHTQKKSATRCELHSLLLSFIMELISLPQI